MYKQAKPFFMIVKTPLHAGSGQDLGIVDQPIQRERHTSFPKIEGSSLKGAIREVFEEYTEVINGSNKHSLIVVTNNDAPINKIKSKFPNIEDNWEINKKKSDGSDEKVTITNKMNEQLIKYNEAISLSFGPENGDDHAGALGFTDARLLLFPVKSMTGVFAYITCPYVLERFKEDLGLCNIKDFSTTPSENTISNMGKIVIPGSASGKIILEEYSFDVVLDQTTTTFANTLATKLPQEIREYIKNKLVILSNDDFKDFVNLSTEVITRIRIEPDTGTVQKGALFTEEYLPAESVLYSLALATPIFKANDTEKGIFKKEDGTNEKDKWKEKEETRVLKFFELGLPKHIQIGGNATIGKGIVETHVYGGTENE